MVWLKIKPGDLNSTFSVSLGLFSWFGRTIETLIIYVITVARRHPCHHYNAYNVIIEINRTCQGILMICFLSDYFTCFGKGYRRQK